MPFASSIKVLGNIITIITQIKKHNDQMNLNVILENEIFYKNIERMSKEIKLYIDKLNCFQELSPTTNEVTDLKSRCGKLTSHINDMNELLIIIENTNASLLVKRKTYMDKWYLCVKRYSKSMFLKDLKKLNKTINDKISLLHSEFNEIEKLMILYETQINNLKFKFLPLRRLWILNKWDVDANQDSQRVTISSFIQEIQGIESCKDRGLHNEHYENMKQFLNNMIKVGKSEKQLDAIGLGKSCGTYFLNNSLLANLTNLPSESLKWTNLSDMVLYFSILPIIKPIDDKITVEITSKWNIANKKRLSSLADVCDETNMEKPQITIADLRTSNDCFVNKIEQKTESNIVTQISNIVPINKKYNAYVIKDNTTFIITYKYVDNRSEVYYKTTSTGVTGNIELSLQPVETFKNYHDTNCDFIRKDYEGNHYFYTPPLLWYKGTGHEYSLHYNILTDVWYLSRFDYSNDTGNGFSGIFVHKKDESYNILQSRGGKKILECNFNIFFK
jgi:hypothetical protein